MGTTNNNYPNRAYLSSLSFQTLFQSRWRNSICPRSIEPSSEQESSVGWAKKSLKDMVPNSNNHFSYTYDNRLEWQCVCQAGFTGPDCSQLRELQCNNEKDDDLDGLSDCEDDDCCSQSVCRDNHMCFKSPEPTKVLETMMSLNQPNINMTAQNNRFYMQMRFLIANESVQSYAQERMFDKSRVAVIRGRVVKSNIHLYETSISSSQSSDLDRGIVSARVSVEDNDQFGFTLTRNDGYFDMLVNGNEWITLQFHRNAYVPIKKKIYVKANTINSLEEDIEMWLSPKLSSSTINTSGTLLNPSSGSLLSSLTADYNANIASSATSNNVVNIPQHQREQKRLDCSFNVQLSAELYKLASNLKRNDERRRNQLFECLLNQFIVVGTQPQRSAPNLRLKYEPLIVLDDNVSVGHINNKQAALNPNQQEQLKSFVLSNSGAFQTQLDEVDQDKEESSFKRIKFIYNSASFPPATSVVKPTLLIHLLPNKLYSSSTEQQQEPKLIAVIIQLDIEGQSRRERLKPLASLSYQFAWDRRNIYNQKVYGFSELSIKIGYEYEQLRVNKSKNVNLIWNDCLLENLDNMQVESTTTINQELLDKFKLPNILFNSYLDKRTVWFEQKVYLEAHQLNQHSDLGKWNLESSNRLDLDHELIYFGSGWSLPYKLVYPPTISEPISLIASPPLSSNEFYSNSASNLRLKEQQQQQQSYQDTGNSNSDQAVVGRLMTRGPNSSMFIIILASAKNARTTTTPGDRLILLDSSRRHHLLDLPLGIVTGKLDISSSSVGNQFNSDTASSATAAADSDDEANYIKRQQTQDDIQILYNNYLSTLYVSSKMGAKIVQVSYSSLLVLNKTLASGSSTSAPEDEVDIEPLAGFERQTLTSTGSLGDAIKAAKQTRLVGPHSMSLDEERQILYFIDGSTNLMAIDLSTDHVILVTALGAPSSSLHYSSQLPNNNCHRDSLQVHLKDYKPHSMHSLVWSKQDSSLYFVDQNVIFALRQDLTLEVIAAPKGELKVPLPIHHSCFSKSELGQIKSLLIDEVNNDLLIVHQWFEENNNKRTAPMSQSGKLSRRFYLAKVKVGIRTSLASGRNSVRRLIDLHSPASAWDPMILKLAISQLIRRQQPNNEQHNGQSINWTEVATIKRYQHQQSIQSPSGSSSSSIRLKGQVGNNMRKIPFIHLSRGFKRIDSIESNSDGSIFALDSSSNSIRLIEPYSPLSSDFNQIVERQDTNINRVFANMNNEPQDFGLDVDNENRKRLNIINMMNPISGHNMEFHALSGLQLSLTESNGDFKSEFYYKILNNNNNNLLELDEDDRNDFNVQKLIQYNYNNQPTSSSLSSSSDYVRLDRIEDSNGNQYEFVRSPTGSRFVLKSIQVNQKTICEVATDYLGVLNTYQASGKDYWLEIVYDSLTYLLRDLVTKEESTSQNLSLSHSHSISHNHHSNKSHNLGWVKTKRIFYDKIFYHFCDLFEASA